LQISASPSPRSLINVLKAYADHWALITGASSGIGAEFARQLAARGMHLVLTARREPLLTQLAAELHQAHGTKTEIVIADLSNPSETVRLLEEVQRRGLTIELLVNNAGFGLIAEIEAVAVDLDRLLLAEHPRNPDADAVEQQHRRGEDALVDRVRGRGHQRGDDEDRADPQRRHADQARAKYAVDGSGVKVGVLSDGIKGVFQKGCTSCGAATAGPVASGDLPDATGVRTAAGVLTSSTGGLLSKSFQANSDLEGLPSGFCAFAGAGAEGTALLEVVHDIAPGAELSFANADTDVAFNQAVNFLAASNDVVTDDLGFYGEASDGTSAVSSNTAAALNNGANQIRAYVTANGNAADEHYYGTYTDSGADGTSLSGLTTTGHLHLFQRGGDTTDVLNLGPKPYNVISLPTNGEVAIFLTWDDTFGGSEIRL
jgi:NAD(P)-dependent dehydrogenase (short-subunit alcohol dehydrogenase family)